MVNYGEAFKRPFTNFTKLIIGILLSIVPIVNFFALGYELEAGKTAMKRNFKLPEWNMWGKYFLRGLLYFVITIIYMIPALIVILIAAGTAAFSGLTAYALSDITAFFAGLIVAAPLIILGIILAILAIYMIPAAVLRYVSTDKFGDAFSFGIVFKKVFSGKYFVPWLIGLIYGLVVGAILGWIPFVGSAISGFITGVTMLTLLGEVYPTIK
ncbi:DUF4013 domain-containing protein [archaeon]|nr:DUF4013 domain-containing protein [archaeon]